MVKYNSLASATSAHGFDRLEGSRTKMEKMFWFIIIFGLWIFFFQLAFLNLQVSLILSLSLKELILCHKL